ncbi:uncharacterized protein C11orf24 homolog isoform X2 [Mytilus californianus]|uniref:uncharacterized protein C11orf24 homolog isoform X2 n=1 Tax=Mytilus californianus TaxID=6549 RepID=UPI00224597AA|nr:uncharacterized protein C11orf24 homolog isoform X2 [Mytilus californianus]
MFILLFFTIVNFHLIQTINHCGPETHFDAPLVDMMFSFTNPSAEELSSLNENSRESCLEQCCNTDKCNIASFNQSLAAVTGDNCFLYKCLPLENCQFQDSVSIISYVLKRDKDDTTTIQNEIDTTDPPPKDQEFIGEKVLEVINDTDIDTDLLKQELNTGNTNFPLLSSSVLSTNTNNLTTKGTTSITLASHPAASTNTNSSPSSNNPLTTATTNKTNSPVSLTSSASSTTQNISSTTVEKQSNGSSTVTNQMVLATNQHPTKASLQPSIVVSTEQGNNKSSVVHPQTTLNNIANTSTKTVLLNETKTTSEPNMANMTELETTLNHAMTTQHNVTSPKKITTTNSILNTLTKALNLTNIVNETAKTTMTTTTSTTTTTTTMMMTTELTTKETTEYLSTKEATTTKETTTSGNDTQTIVTNQPTTESSNMSKSTEKPITTGDLNITFADTNQMKEEKEESNVLSAALIAALSFGILFFFAVLVLIGKRCFDSWQKRHYSRIDYLVNGMYN